mmetsp:Transcript_113235/g.196388  ORF Transcript_113235/g.196388 Transcript_113235/m.196388 type:complete len:229 (-) Transcript_113235:196-882(-)
MEAKPRRLSSAGSAKRNFAAGADRGEAPDRDVTDGEAVGVVLRGGVPRWKSGAWRPSAILCSAGATGDRPGLNSWPRAPAGLTARPDPAAPAFELCVLGLRGAPSIVSQLTCSRSTQRLRRAVSRCAQGRVYSKTSSAKSRCCRMLNPRAQLKMRAPRPARDWTRAPTCMPSTAHWPQLNICDALAWRPTASLAGAALCGVFLPSPTWTSVKGAAASAVFSDAGSPMP